jgi:hypothetical protein
MEFGPQHLGKWLVVFGVALIVLGLLMMGLGKLGLFRLPGDLEFQGRHWKVYFPIASCIVLSILLTLIVWLITLFRR